MPVLDISDEKRIQRKTLHRLSDGSCRIRCFGASVPARSAAGAAVPRYACLTHWRHSGQKLKPGTRGDRGSSINTDVQGFDDNLENRESQLPVDQISLFILEIDALRDDQPIECTLAPLPKCPTNRDHLSWMRYDLHHRVVFFEFRPQQDCASMIDSVCIWLVQHPAERFFL